MKIEYRPLTESDLPMLHQWLNRPHLKRWWRAETTLEEVRDKYLPRIAGADAAVPYLGFVGDQPVSYNQSYRVRGSIGGLINRALCFGTIPNNT